MDHAHNLEAVADYHYQLLLMGCVPRVVPSGEGGEDGDVGNGEEGQETP